MKAAFDSVKHKLLEKKLLHIGFSYDTISWIKSYISKSLLQSQN